jgi:hypothetical protein
MKTVLVHYRTNPDYYDDGVELYHADYVLDVAKLRAVVDTDDCYYAQDEIKKILWLVDNPTKLCDLHEHDKYTLYDTSWELELVLADDQESKVDLEIYVLLNA